MDTLSYKTISANSETVQKDWYIVDAEGEVLGRLASKVAKILRGKNKPDFTPHVDCGDNIIVINAEKVRLTGNKWENRVHFRHTGYPGGQRRETASEIHGKNPAKTIEMSVRGMLPKNRLGRKIFGNLYVYAGNEHEQEAQQPKSLNLNDIK